MVGGHQYQKMMEEQRRSSSSRRQRRHSGLNPEHLRGLGIDDAGMGRPAAEALEEVQGKGKGKEREIPPEDMQSESSSSASTTKPYQSRWDVRPTEEKKNHFVDESEEVIDVKFFGPKSETDMLPGWNHEVYLEDEKMPGGVSGQAQKICMSPGRGCIVRIDLLEEACRQRGERPRVDMFTDKATPLEEAKRRGLEIMVTVPRYDYNPDRREDPVPMLRSFLCFGTSYIPFRIPVVDRDGREFPLAVRLKCMVVNDDYRFFTHGKPGDRDVRMWIGHTVLADERVSTRPPPLWSYQDDPERLLPTKDGYPRGHNRFSVYNRDKSGSSYVECNNVYDEWGNLVAKGEMLDILLSEADDIFTDPLLW
ncbi:hypothetical protein B0A52_06285 [Exophiala mesophila]|uniref:Uncharacterized protein n=1 Tax=Exophiala mesophila TaxID=212818 RepID=A0A438N345_EXOME|nr:hypothetical protein B0A52_06285 [Exophiala mesophila]